MTKLLLLHGALGAKSQFAGIEQSLAGSLEVYSLNFSGHGGEPLPEVPFSIELFAGDVLRWLDANKIDKINLFGYSMGGYVALYLALKHPDKIGKIFTLATKLEWSEEISAREVKMLDAVKIKEKVPKFAEELSQRHGADKWEAVLGKTAEMMINLGRKNRLTPEDYTKIEHDVTLGVGDRDKMVSIEETTAAYRKLKNGKLLVMPDTPHPLEQVNAERLCYEIKEIFR